MDLLPKEIYDIIFRYLSSKDRSIICSVSSLFESVSLNILGVKNLQENRSKDEIIDIINSKNYHLLVRLKSVHSIDFVSICKYGDIDIAELIIPKLTHPRYGKKYWNKCFREACTNELSIVKLIINKGNVDWYGGLVAACKVVKMDIIKFLIKEHQYNQLDLRYLIHVVEKDSNLGRHDINDIKKLLIDEGGFGNIWKRNNLRISFI